MYNFLCRNNNYINNTKIYIWKGFPLSITKKTCMHIFVVGLFLCLTLIWKIGSEFLGNGKKRKKKKKKEEQYRCKNKYPVLHGVTMVACRCRTLFLKWATANILSARNGKWGRWTNVDLGVFGPNVRRQPDVKGR